MERITKEDYLRNPCRASSIPYWKAKSISLPAGMKILHHDNYNESDCRQYTDAPYFRLIHDLKGLSQPVLPQGYSLCKASLRDFAAHINRCYTNIGISEAELQDYTTRPVYDSSLWLAVMDQKTGDIAATGIAELDPEIGEGVLEWIQVSQEHRSRGLGKYIVSELLWRMQNTAAFATVSGQCDNPDNPQRLYRRCGFTGSDLWHILRKQDLS